MRAAAAAKGRAAGLALARGLFLTADMFSKKGLPNHAAACAYGFLLSSAPLLLVVSFFLIRALRATPEAVAALLGELAFMEFAAEGLLPALEFMLYAPAGVATLVFMLSVLWSGRLFAASMQRGLKVVFAGEKRRGAAIEALVALAVELAAILAILVALLGSRLALALYGAVGLFRQGPLSVLLSSPLAALSIRFAAILAIAYLSCAHIPARRPTKRSAFIGAFFCAASYGAAYAVFSALLNQPRYNILYGALGEIVVALVSVYFFFVCFFLGCQLAAVIDSFESLLFIKLREAGRDDALRSGAKRSGISRALFGGAAGALEKYLRRYTKGQAIVRRGEEAKEVFYIMEGEAEIIAPNGNAGAQRAGPGSFVGEIGSLLGEGRSATVRASGDLSALALPKALFQEIIGHDAALDRSIIEGLSRAALSARR
ncbi:MAG: YihY/virulence factor BrkB family protein [Treponema sp.]|nr:YihY/virulence factor BrkB family protein [Treponema sp.]